MNEPTGVRALTEKERGDLGLFVRVRPAGWRAAPPVRMRLLLLGLLARHEPSGDFYISELGERAASEQGIR